MAKKKRTFNNLMVSDQQTKWRFGIVLLVGRSADDNLGGGRQTLINCL